MTPTHHRATMALPWTRACRTHGLCQARAGLQDVVKIRHQGYSGTIGNGPEA